MLIAGRYPIWPPSVDALSEIDGALDTHADLISEDGAVLVVRIAEWNFERPYFKRAQPRCSDRERRF